jgi:dipeptidyl-peptidase-3
MMPEFSQEWFTQQVRQCDPNQLPLTGKSFEEFTQLITPVIFDPKVAPKKVNLDKSSDLIKTSAVNIYENVSQEQVTSFYKDLAVKGDATPPSYGLNTKLMSENGTLVEKTWKVGGMYSPAIEKIVSWLTKASAVAENPHQQNVINLLIEYYKTGDLRKFDQYSIEWVKDTSVVDFVNGFIEVYHDPLGYKGSWEAYVSLKDMEATKRIHAISSQAQWFEDNSPLLAEHKKKNVKGISAKVINVVVEAGDLAPLTAIGINLPNAEWIREQHGSKSVTINNITKAYAEDGKSSGVVEEFYYNDTIKTRLKKFGSITDNLHTDMHEVIGHASGQINPGTGTFNETLKNYANTLEEARADLVALYYMIDPKLVEIGVMPTAEAGLSEYDRYINNGMMVQLTRLPANENQLEEAHMRNRQLIAAWCYEKGIKENVIEKVTKDGKTYFVVRDYKKLRDLFGQLLREVQRIKSEGDYNAGSALVENYGVRVDPALHKEVLERYQKLNISPYKGFIQPKLVPVMNGSEITDVKLEYPDDFTKQMMEYSKNYSFLPTKN